MTGTAPIGIGTDPRGSSAPVEKRGALDIGRKNSLDLRLLPDPMQRQWLPGVADLHLCLRTTNSKNTTRRAKSRPSTEPGSGGL